MVKAEGLHLGPVKPGAVHLWRNSGASTSPSVRSHAGCPVSVEPDARGCHTGTGGVMCNDPSLSRRNERSLRFGAVVDAGGQGVRQPFSVLQDMFDTHLPLLSRVSQVGSHLEARMLTVRTRAAMVMSAAAAASRRVRFMAAPAGRG